MSSSNDEAAPQSGQGEERSVGGAQGLPVEFIRYLAAKAIDLRGGLPPSANAQLSLRLQEDKQALLEDFFRAVCPRDVSPLLWSRWLEGGTPPFEKTPTRRPLRKPTQASERPANLVNRTSPRVTEQESVIADLRARLEIEEEHLTMLRAHDNAAIYFVVVNQLLEMVQPVFAMGPAWTVMRALSGSISDEALDEELSLFDGKEKEERKKEMRKHRARQTDEMFATLDDFSGIEEFEEALREAARKVCVEFEKKRDKLITDGHRRRSEQARWGSVHPRAQAGADEVLDGLPS